MIAELPQTAVPTARSTASDLDPGHLRPATTETNTIVSVVATTTVAGRPIATIWSRLKRTPRRTIPARRSTWAANVAPARNRATRSPTNCPMAIPTSSAIVTSAMNGGGKPITIRATIAMAVARRTPGTSVNQPGMRARMAGSDDAVAFTARDQAGLNPSCGCGHEAVIANPGRRVVRLELERCVRSSFAGPAGTRACTGRRSRR